MYNDNIHVIHTILYNEKYVFMYQEMFVVIIYSDV